MPKIINVMIVLEAADIAQKITAALNASGSSEVVVTSVDDINLAVSIILQEKTKTDGVPYDVVVVSQGASLIGGHEFPKILRSESREQGVNPPFPAVIIVGHFGNDSDRINEQVRAGYFSAIDLTEGADDIGKLLQIIEEHCAN